MNTGRIVWYGPQYMKEYTKAELLAEANVDAKGDVKEARSAIEAAIEKYVDFECVESAPSQLYDAMDNLNAALEIMEGTA